MKDSSECTQSCSLWAGVIHGSVECLQVLLRERGRDRCKDEERREQIQEYAEAALCCAYVIDHVP